MSERTMVPMNSLIKSISMGPFGSDVKVEYMGNVGVPIIDGSNLTSIKMNMNSYRFLDKDRVKKLDAALAHKGDIVVTHRGTLGQLSYVPEDCLFDEVLISQSQFRVTLDTSQVNPIYFAYYFHTTEGQKRLLSFANYVGVPALACATTNFRKLLFPLIPLEEQNRIATLLEELDLSITNNNIIISELESIAKDIYDYWFVQFDFPDENGKPYKLSGGKMVWNEELKREIPEGWTSVRLNTVLGKYPKTGSILREDYTRGTRFPIVDQSRDYICGYTNETNKVLFMNDAIVFGDHTNYAKYVNFPFARGADGTQIINSNNDCLPNHLLYQQIINLPVIEEGYSRHFKFLKEQLIIVPQKEIANNYEKTILPFMTMKLNCLKQNRELSSLRDWLLPMLMNGQVKVGGAV